MTLFGWRQLIEWSMEHSCLSEKEYAKIHEDWLKKWNIFLADVIKEFGNTASRVP